MQSLNKLILNNKIVEFRKHARQSRVHCINKLSREIKKLKEKKGTDKQKEKNTKKAERYLEQISVMKSLKDDEISKFALLNEKSMTDITNDMNESLEKKSLARLVHHKAIQDKVKNFRETFPEWRQYLELLLDTLGEKYKYKKQVKSSNMKKQKPISKEKKVHTIHNRSGTWTVEEIKPVREKREIGKDLSKSKPNTARRMFLNEEQLKEKTEKELQKYPKRDLDDPDSSNISASVKPTVIEKIADVMEDFIQLDTNNSNYRVEETVTKEESTVEGAVDPFFLTKDNSEYVSVSAKENANKSIAEVPQFEDHDRKFNRDDRNRRREPKQLDFGRNRWQEPKEREFNHGKDHIRRRDSKILKSKNSFSRNSNFNDYEAPPKPVHPSWEAKKRLSQIVQFEGKKIKFDAS